MKTSLKKWGALYAPHPISKNLEVVSCPTGLKYSFVI
jgi:hypothetical protein